MISNNTRTWVGGTVLLLVVVLLASWFLLISPKQAEAGELRQQALDLDASNTALEGQLVQLKADYARLPEATAELAALREGVPATLDLSELTRQLSTAASSSGVALMSIAPATPTAAAAEAPVAAVPADPTARAAEDPAETPVTTPASGAVSTQVSLQVVGSYAGAQAFLRELQGMTRNLLVTSFTVTSEQDAAAAAPKPATENGDVTLDVVGKVFVLPDAATAPPGAAAPAPSPLPTAP
jgi:type IV pilus assembly protein PilO